MSTFSATSSEESSATTENGIQVTATASATATSNVSQIDAQNTANLIATQNAISEAQFSANLLNQSVVVNNLQNYEPVLQGYVLYSEAYQNENYIIKTDKYEISTLQLNLYDINTNEIIGRLGNYKQVHYDTIYTTAFNQNYIILNDLKESYMSTRFQYSKYVPIGTTFISLVTTYHNDTTNKDTNQFIPHMWKTYRPSVERLEFTILKGKSDNSF